MTKSKMLTKLFYNNFILATEKVAKSHKNETIEIND